MTGTSDPLGDMLAVAIPQEIARLLAKGGPDKDDYDAMPAAAQRLACNGDVLLYGGKKDSQAQLFALLTWSMAVLAFCPGGVTAYGRHWEAARPGRIEPEHK